MASMDPRPQLQRFGMCLGNILWDSIALPVTRLCEKFSVYENKEAAADLNVAQWFLLSIMHSIFTEDFLLSRFLVTFSMSFNQLKSNYLKIWLRDDFNFVREDVIRGLEMLNGLVIQERLEIPEVLVRILSGLAEKYNLTDETERDLPEVSLTRAVASNYALGIISAAKRGADVNTKIDLGNSLYHLAVNLNCIESITALGYVKANVEVLGADLTPPIHRAVSKDSGTAVTALAAAGAHFNLKLSEGNTLVHLAVMKGCNNALSSLLQLGADCDKKNFNGLSPISVAVSASNAVAFELLLKRGVDLNKGEFLLHSACTVNNVDIVKELIKGGVKTDVKNDAGLLPIHVSRDKEIVEELLRSGAAIDATSTSGDTAINFAASEGKLNFLICSGANVNIKGDTALLLAAGYNKENVVQLLLENKADPNIIGRKGFAAIHKAVECGSLRIFQMLLAMGADPRLRTSHEQFNVLHIAALHAHDDIIKYLLKSEICNDLIAATCKSSEWSYNKKFWNFDFYCSSPPLSWTALHLSALKGHSTVVRTLLESTYFNPDIKDYYGLTPLDLAAFSGNVTAVKELLQHGAKPQCGLSPMHFAADQGNVEILKLLIENGLDVNVAYNRMYSPLHIACYGGHIETVIFLLNNGARINGSIGYTPYYYSKLNYQKAVTDLLLSRGASAKDRF